MARRRVSNFGALDRQTLDHFTARIIKAIFKIPTVAINVVLDGIREFNEFATISRMRRNPCFENMSENESQAHQDLAVRGMILNWSNQRPINHPIFVKNVN